jgi:hypothetical protein
MVALICLSYFPRSTSPVVGDYAMALQIEPTSLGDLRHILRKSLSGVETESIDNIL